MLIYVIIYKYIVFIQEKYHLIQYHNYVFLRSCVMNGLDEIELSVRKFDG